VRSRDDSLETFVLSEAGGSVLVDGRVAALAADSIAAPGGGPAADAEPARGAQPLPISRACFACGTDNELGLRARLAFDAETVHGTWEPRAPFRRADGSLAPAALTTLLDEAAFWLGALATGESGMTTELRVSLHRPAPFAAPVTVTGARAAVRPRDGDPRYQETEIVARTGGRVVATARITFVVVRGAARRLVGGMLAINDAECVRRVFPAYAR
jgi:acyl-coenzyme A thioesterase PaaI-like protein